MVLVWQFHLWYVSILDSIYFFFVLQLQISTRYNWLLLFEFFFFFSLSFSCSILFYLLTVILFYTFLFSISDIPNGCRWITGSTYKHIAVLWIHGNTHDVAVVVAKNRQRDGVLNVPHDASWITRRCNDFSSSIKKSKIDETHWANVVL